MLKHFSLSSAALLLHVIGLAQYTLTVESAPAVGAGGTVYRFYVDMQDATDRMSAVFGNDQASLLINTPAGAFNSTFNSSWNASGINPAFLAVFPDLADDTYATIGLSGPASTSGIAGAADPSIVEDATQAITPYFLTPGATNLTSTTLTGASWYVLNTAANGLPDADLRVLIMQVTTAGAISGQINFQVFPLGEATDQQQLSVNFNGAGTYTGCNVYGTCEQCDPGTLPVNYSIGGGSYVSEISWQLNDADGNNLLSGVAEEASGQICLAEGTYTFSGTDSYGDGWNGNVANFSIFGNLIGSYVMDVYDCFYAGDGSYPAPGCTTSITFEVSDTFSCSSIPEGDCDCNGNKLDVVGVCGGECTSDEDGDGICDDVDPCVGTIDACGICGGDSVPGCNDPNACNYSPEADCDVNCIYVGCPQLGCTDEEACNFDDSADFEDGSCEYLSCGGCTIELACNYDADAGFDDGSCDFITCLVFGCTDESACNYDASAQFNDGGCTYPNFPYDCQGACQSDSDGDGICDPLEIEGCTNPLACNFSSGATDDDGSCEFGCAGCTNVLACNYNPGATADDGSCDFLSCNGVGCINVSACNYDANASINDGSCIFPPSGDCDCSGNQLDVLGVCGGDCTEDANANGVCDNAEILGCTLEAALNFNANANVEDGSCVLITDLPEDLQFVTTPISGLLLGTITVDDLPLTEPALLAAFNPQGACVGWNMLVQAEDQTVVALAIYGDDPTTPLIDGMVPGQAFTLQLVLLNSAVTLTYGENPAIEIEGWVNTNGTPIPGLDNVETEYPFLYLTACEDAAACNYNPGSEGVEDCQYPEPELDCNGDCLVDTDSDGVCDAFEIFGCTSVGACNYDELATEEDGSCLTLDVCGVCGGTGIPEGDCDCNGNQLDALGECGGACAADIDADGLCDDIDDCVGSYDGCGVCNGPGAIYECGCTDILEGDCDCGGNQLDALGVCGGDCDADEDADGICDDVDDCVGAYDECGVCNGLGAIYECGCADIPAGACNCDGNLLDALGICDGDCAADVDADGVCDDVDDCIGEFDACGICNGPGAIYECGCADIPDMDCDCDGNQLDALGVCGGDCTADADADGICDDVDDCVGAYDECGICNGPGAIFECGCADIPVNDCDCDGNQLDALGACGGDCANDDDMDGVCDNIDECVGAYDALGICNGSCEEDQDGDGVCDSEEVFGCDDESAINYDSSATENDGNCNYLSEAPAGFDFTPTPSSATMYGYVTIDGLNATGLDWIGAFTPEGICAGATSLYMYEGQAYINMTIYGDDATTLDVQEGVASDGTFVLKLYDASTSIVLEHQNGVALTGWYNTNGGPLPGYNDPQTEYPFYYPTCADENACNFDSNSLTNEGCEYPSPFFDCDGVCLGDFNLDGVVQLNDLLDLLSDYGLACESCSTDMNGDGLVQLNDMLDLLSKYGNICTP